MAFKTMKDLVSMYCVPSVMGTIKENKAFPDLKM